MSTHLDNNLVAVVDDDVYWRSMSTCPRGAKVNVLGRGGVATTAVWDGKDNFWVGWYPNPKIPPEIRELMRGKA